MSENKQNPAESKDCRITLYLDTPKPLLRPFKDFKKHNQLAALFMYGSLDPAALTGHAFIGITDEKGNEERWGYTCTGASLMKTLTGVRGMVVCEDRDCIFNEAIIYPVTRQQYDAAQEKIYSTIHDPKEYVLFKNNCSTFANSILKAAKVEDAPSDKLGLPPYGLVLKKRFMLAKRRLEVLRFKSKNLIAELFGQKKAPTSELLASLKSKPIPVPINNAMKAAKTDPDQRLDMTKTLRSLSWSR